MLKLKDIGIWEARGIMEELIYSAPVHRLKAVHQGGANYPVDPSQQHTSYRHSLGVYLAGAGKFLRVCLYLLSCDGDHLI